MALHGSELGVELSELYHAGTYLLPEVADEYRGAKVSTPYSPSAATSRGSALGDDPGAALDKFAQQILKALGTTEKRLTDVGAALVLCANEYAATDEAARDTFQTRKRQIDGEMKDGGEFDGFRRR